MNKKQILFCISSLLLGWLGGSYIISLFVPETFIEMLLYLGLSLGITILIVGVCIAFILMLIWLGD